MLADKENKFDKTLSQALKKHCEPVPANFTDRLLRQIEEAEEQKILARVVMEERLVLVGCIVLGIMAIVAAAVFPSVAVSLRELTETSIDKITRLVEAVRYDWQLYVVFAGVFAFAVCSFADLLISDSR
jgi:hypothetical protein